MITLVITYANEPGSWFDFDYYTQVHNPLAERLLREYGIGRIDVLRAETAADGSSPAYLCVTTIEFDSAEEMRAGFGAHGAELAADFAKYTNVSPVATVTAQV